jgi:hypothetical protein
VDEVLLLQLDMAVVLVQVQDTVVLEQVLEHLPFAAIVILLNNITYEYLLFYLVKHV